MTVATPASAVTSSTPTGATYATSESGNWAGYVQQYPQDGTTTPFTQVSGDWTVPTASQHTAGQAESSATWVGIGGACLNSACDASDLSLIQAGTVQQVASDGTSTYYPVWEVIPGPAFDVSGPVISAAPGDKMHVDIRQVVSGSELWTITIDNRTTGQEYSTIVPYSSSMISAEWITEAQLSTSNPTNPFALPNLSTVGFNNADSNRGPAVLQPNQAMFMVGSPYATPSAPDSTGTAFNVCAWASSCPAP